MRCAAPRVAAPLCAFSHKPLAFRSLVLVRIVLFKRQVRRGNRGKTVSISAIGKREEFSHQVIGVLGNFSRAFLPKSGKIVEIV